MPSPGKFILFEGGDRCGKTTQATRLVKRLNATGHAAVLMRFPDRSTPIGHIIDSYLGGADMDDRTIHLLFLANRWECIPKLLSHLHQGVHVVVDRFSYSGVAYSSVKPGISYEWCVGVEAGLPKPDILLYMSPIGSGSKLRNGWGEERYETDAIQQQVHLAFLRLAEEDDGVEWNRVDSEQSIEDVERRVDSIVLPRLIQ